MYGHLRTTNAGSDPSLNVAGHRVVRRSSRVVAIVICGSSSAGQERA